MFLHGMFPLSKTFIILYRYHTKFLSCHGTSLFTLFVIFNEICWNLSLEHTWTFYLSFYILTILCIYQIQNTYFQGRRQKCENVNFFKAKNPAQRAEIWPKLQYRSLNFFCMDIYESIINSQMYQNFIGEGEGAFLF